MRDIEHPEVPYGLYCYDENGVCPHWIEYIDNKGGRSTYCDLFGYNGLPEDETMSLIDQIKECGINDDDED